MFGDSKGLIYGTYFPGFSMALCRACTLSSWKCTSLVFVDNAYPDVTCRECCSTPSIMACVCVCWCRFFVCKGASEKVNYQHYRPKLKRKHVVIGQIHPQTAFLKPLLRSLEKKNHPHDFSWPLVQSISGLTRCF